MQAGERTRWLMVLTVAAWLVTVPAAGAYIDGGSLTVVFQVLIAAMVTAGLAVRAFWSRIATIFRRTPAESAASDGAGAPSPAEPATTRDE